jgi:hypothetical protein
MGDYLYKPAEIIRDKRLSPIEQDYLCLIAGLEKAGGCRASNQYFADYFGVKRHTAVEVISRLKAKGFIDTFETKSGGKTIERTITVIDADSRKFLLSDSRKLRLTDRSGIVGNSDSDSRKSPTLIIKSIIYTFVLNNGNEWTLPPGKIDEYRQAFPRLDVESELRKAGQWLIDNPARRKTAKGMLRFLSGWLGRAKTTDSNSRERDKGREAGFLDSQTREATPEEADEFLRAAVC